MRRGSRFDPGNNYARLENFTVQNSDAAIFNTGADKRKKKLDVRSSVGAIDPKLSHGVSFTGLDCPGMRR
jgi:hypothetical protein